jgi:hypothetical protein
MADGEHLQGEGVGVRDRAFFPTEIDRMRGGDPAMRPPEGEGARARLRDTAAPSDTLTNEERRIARKIDCKSYK